MTVIRSMRWWDLSRVHEIEVECFPRDSWSPDQFWRELSGENRDYAVAERNDVVVGYAGISTIEPESDLQTLAVEPASQGLGIGAALLNEMLDRARRRSATSMLLEVRADNPPAHALYTRAGFESIATRSRYYPDGGDAIIMRCRPLTTRAQP